MVKALVLSDENGMLTRVIFPRSLHGGAAGRNPVPFGRWFDSITRDRALSVPRSLARAHHISHPTENALHASSHCRFESDSLLSHSRDAGGHGHG